VTWCIVNLLCTVNLPKIVPIFLYIFSIFFPWVTGPQHLIGMVGSTYKAVMETGFIVTVKRLREVAGKEEAARDGEEFRRKAEDLGRVRHPNIVPLRAYFQAKEEKLLVYDYFPNGSLFSLIHG
jgi:serine/threonine protein kinase